MAASTTLMTFMVRTPPNTRSVALYGSWDNFLMPYAMRRDTRLGVEHWTGCHSFSNIICDGNVESIGFSRSGGLRMGGTYWYYYKLDDEIEFHNSAEPATTRCPLLPGQLINELQVPFALSGSRTRDASMSSTSSERRTLDPEAKFVNPRPAPARPKTIRLNTSPTMLEASVMPNDHSGDTVSAAPLMQSDQIQRFWEPSSKLFHLPRKPSLDALLKTKSPKKIAAPLRSPFQFSVPSERTRRDEKYQDIINWIPDRQATMNEPELVSVEPVTAIEAPAIEAPAIKPSRRGLLLRANSEEAITLASFREHRRQRSRSRERSNRNSLVSDETAHIDVSAARGVEQGFLSAVLEVTTPEGTPAYGPNTGRRITLEALEGRIERDQDDTGLEKRLPTLPNTPSSAYPPTQHGDTPARQLAGDLTVLDSHFSTTTIDTALTHETVNVTEDAHDRFLQLTNNNTWSTSIKDEEYYYSPATDEEFDPFMSASSKKNVRANALNSLPPRTLSSNVSESTIISSVSTTPTTSYSEYEVGSSSHHSQVTSIRSSGDSLGHYQHYSLPEVENASEVTLKQYNPSLVNNAMSKASRHQSTLSHSEGMQQLLDELSYLSGMIQAEGS